MMPEDRKLHKCGICGEWFNTTSIIMLQHVAGHLGSRPGLKAQELYRLMMLAATYHMKAVQASFMLSAVYFGQAAVCWDQFSKVLAQAENDSEVLP